MTDWPTRKYSELPLATLILALLFGSAVLGEEGRSAEKSPYLPEFTGVALIHCYCTLGTSGCGSDFFWRLAGSPVHDWWQEIHLVDGKEVDLASACFRKRDAEKLGGGLCCSVNEKDGKPDDVMLRKFFGVSEVKQKQVSRKVSDKERRME
jgi:hypothetical protein